MKIHLAQLLNPQGYRKLAIIQADSILVRADFNTAYDLVIYCLANNTSIGEQLKTDNTACEIEIVALESLGWQWLPSFDHPYDAQHCMVSGTGLTHKASAQNRENMNAAKTAGTQTDSMRMYELGEQQGKPANGQIGVQPEWFYKGNGSVLRAHNQALTVPSYALDGGEEPEIAGVYVINNEGIPVRVGFTAGNEFSDHVMEKINYLYLAPSKIRSCSIGPALVIGEAFEDLSGSVAIQRAGQVLWQKEIVTGQQHMAHSLENLEHHHFKYANHRLPGQVHIHFMGTGAFSFGVGLQLQAGDTMHVAWPAMGITLVNHLEMQNTTDTLVKVAVL
jgi:hypothetical protein